MKLVKAGVLFVALSFVGHAQSSEAVSMEKIKTGILPTGGFYSIYEAACPGKSNVHVASLDRRTRWCIQNDEQLNCFRRSGDAARAACSSVDLVATEEGLDAINAFQ